MSGAGWAIEALVASALLLVAVLLIRVPVRRAFGPAVAYGLWALPLLRLLLPPLPAGWREAAATPISRAGETLVVLVVDPAASPMAMATDPALGIVPALVVWSAGAAAFLLFHFVRHARFRARVLGSAEMVERVAGVAVVVSRAAPGPLAFGVWHRFVVFPHDFAERYDPDERDMALAHELGHHQRGDLLANWLALGVLAAHWFNPFAWAAFRAFRADQELANDARVLAGRTAAQRHAYGRAIVKAAGSGVFSATCHLHTITDLKGRLKMLARSPASSRRLASGATTVGMLVVAGLGLTASGSGAAALAGTVGAQVVSVPAPPAPVPPASTPSAPVPPAPLPPAPAMGATSPVTKTTKRVVIVRNGDATTFEGAEADAFIAANPVLAPPSPPLPPGEPRPPVRIYSYSASVPGGGAPLRVIRFRDANGKQQVIPVPAAPMVARVRCGGDASGKLVESVARSGEPRIVVCTDRIEASVRLAERIAANADVTERQARSTARSNLGMARAAIGRDRDLSEKQRRQALDGIAQAEAELTEAK